VSDAGDIECLMFFLKLSSSILARLREETEVEAFWMEFYLVLVISE
jgi:hypothetical protein